MKNDFFLLAQKSGFTKAKANKLWISGLQAYTNKNRHYHTLEHVEKMFALSQQYEQKLQKTTVVRWAIWFHDLIYNTLRSDNEKRSAAHALRILKESALQPAQYLTAVDFIIATKDHQTNGEDSDLNYFLDFDLWVLGQPQDTYKRYTAQIRSEYRFVPELLYRKGRCKVLKHFLSQTIYKTEDFQERYETQARMNLEIELQELS